MSDLNLDYTLFIPEFLMVGLAALVVAVDQFAPQLRKQFLSWIAATGLAAIAGISLAWIDVESNFAGIVAVDNYTTYFRVFFMGMAAVICIASGRYVEDRLKHPGEYYCLVILSTIGAIGMAASPSRSSA